jgi:quercetin 2,3-dioxygenase
MNQIIHRAADRIENDFGWLQIRASFRHDAKNHHQRSFGKLVILDDALMIPGGRGFQLHPHEDMEIISWVLSGTDEHNDSKDGITLIHGGEVQLMSAGSGIEHAENNHSLTDAVHMFQIWIEPDKRQIPAAYQTKSIRSAMNVNELYTFVTPTGEGGSLVINQQAYISIANMEKGGNLRYNLRDKANGLYLFVVLGNISVRDTNLLHRDAVGLSNIDTADVFANQYSQVLFIEVPL